jgi:transposase InsO family protein
MSEISQQDSDLVSMDPKQYDQDIEEKLLLEKEVLIQMTEQGEQPTKITALFAKALNQGEIPMNPADYIHHIMARVKIPTHGGVYSYTIAQFASKCKEDGINLTINSLEEIATMIATLEAEYGMDSKVGAGLILYLVVKSSDGRRRQMVDNLIWAFTMADNRKAFTEEVCWRGAAPAYLAGGYPPLAKMEFGSADWEDLFSCLIACIGGSGDPYNKFLKARSDWLSNKQEGSIQTYLYTESRLWGNLINQSRWIDRPPPSDKDRMDTLCCNLKKEFMEKLSTEVRRKDIAPRNMTLGQVVDILKEIDNQETKVFPWEASAQGATSTCPHCKRSGTRHTPEECRSNPENNKTPLQKKRVTWEDNTAMKRQTYPVDSNGEQSYSFMVEKKNVTTNPLFTATLADRRGKAIRIGFDTFSSVTLIKPGLCEERDITVGPPIPLLGIGGERTTSGKSGKIHMSLDGKWFNVTGCITETPDGVDVLLGTPQLISMGAVIDLGEAAVVFKNFFQKRLQLKPIERQRGSQEAWEISLPEMTVEVDMKRLAVPYQCTRSHTVPKSLQTKADEVIRMEIDKGHLEEVAYSADLWISPVFFKQKSSGALRLLVDLSLLNKFVTTPDYWSLMGANRSMFLGSIPKNCYFTKIDISDAFHSCPVEKNSRRFLAVRYGNQLLQYKTAPQGLSTSALFWPLHLASGLNQLLGAEWTKFAKIYVDDILIYGENRQDCVQKTQSILAALKEMGKDVSNKSVTDPSPEIECIGFVFGPTGCRISDQGIEKLRAALGKTPKTMKDMRGLIGSIQYAKSVFTHSGRPSEVAEYLAKLLKFVAGKRFVYDPEIKAVQAELMKRINPVYQEFTDHSDESHLVITTDASDYGVGAVLYQVNSCLTSSFEDKVSNGKIIDIVCKPLSSGQQKWHTFEKEGYAIKEALIKWRPLMIASGKQITLYTDSTTAKGQYNQRSLIETNTAKNKRWCGWLEKCSFIHALPFKITAIQGDQNHLADMLSRLESPHQEIWSVSLDWNNRIQEAQMTDPSIAARTDLERGEDGLLRKHERIFVPDGIISEVVQGIHNLGHFGIRETVLHFKAHYWGDKLTEKVAEVCRKCDCYASKAERSKSHPIGTLAADGVPWEHICMDTVGPLKPSSRGKNYILTTICRSTKFMVIRAIQDISSTTICETLESIFREQSYPTSMVLDNFPTFKSKQFARYAELNGIELRFTPVYAPERNGLLERQHKIIGQLLRFHFEYESQWDKWISHIQCRLNDRTLKAMEDGSRITPFNLVHRISYRHPHLPQEKQPGQNYDELMDQIKSIEVFEQAERRHSLFTENQQVLRHCPVINVDQSSKFNRRFKKSVITKVMGRNTYLCRDEDGATTVCDGRSLRRVT